ncbi:MAG: hypothetical protein MUF06_09080 [Pirellulaceae bacterium]|nr:hypothetical protein [Pirellulaceae bacterium]
MAALRTKGRRGHGRQKSGERRLKLEHLETRAMLAGNVSVSVSGGNLLVRGDNSSNQIAIVQLDAGEYAVVGLNGTEVNGGTDPVVKSGVTNNIDVDLKNGHDVLGISNDIDFLEELAYEEGLELPDLELPEDAPECLTVPKHLNIKLGSGNDAAAVGAKVGLRINADLGSGNDALWVEGSKVGDDIIARGGSGHDYLYINKTKIAQMLDVNMGDGENGVYVDCTQIGESAVIRTGKNNDYVYVVESQIEDNLIVRTGSGHDGVIAGSIAGMAEAEGEASSGGYGIEVGNNVDIDTGSGDDYVDVSGDIDNLLKVSTGSGHDEVYMYYVDAEDLVAVLGSGNDYLSAYGVHVHDDALLDAGSGNDVAYIRYSEVDDVLTALMGSGNDFLEICESWADKANLDGGSGKDELRSDIPDPLPSGVKVKNFEYFSECYDNEEETPV